MLSQVVVPATQLPLKKNVVTSQKVLVSCYPKELTERVFWPAMYVSAVMSRLWIKVSVLITFLSC